MVLSLYYCRLAILLVVRKRQIKCQGMDIARTQH